MRPEAGARSQPSGKPGGGTALNGSVSAGGALKSWCFHCCAVNDHPAGPCDARSQSAGLPWTGSLIRALHHPDGDRAVLTASTLGRSRARESIPALREAAEAGGDIYLRAAALRSLIAIEGAESLRSWPDELSRAASFNVRATARRTLEETAGDDAR